jgi:hypothetical protein
MKLRFKNEFGGPLNILEADSITVYFPREDGSYLSKRDFNIINAQRGELELQLSSFEIGALKIGDQQDFFAKVVVGDESLTLRFAKGLNVKIKDERKVVDE